MVFMVAAGITLVTIAAQAAPVASGSMDLFCRGRGDRFVDAHNRPQFNTAIRIRIENGAGQALVPNDMLSEGDTRGWHDIKDLAVSPVQVKGKIKFGWLSTPSMSLDRDSGALEISGTMANFSGTCRPYDRATSIMPASAPRPVAPPPRPMAAVQPSGVHTDWARPPKPAAAVSTSAVRAPGTFVLARFKGGAEWYPAQVMRSAGNLVTVQYGGGAQESLPSALITNMTWKVGSYIECKLTTGRVPVTIVAARPGYVIDVVTNAGKKMTLNMQACRSAPRG